MNWNPPKPVVDSLMNDLCLKSKRCIVCGVETTGSMFIDYKLFRFHPETKLYHEIVKEKRFIHSSCRDDYLT